MKNNIDKASVLACLPACRLLYPTSCSLDNCKRVAFGPRGGVRLHCFVGGATSQRVGSKKGRGRTGKRVQHINLQSNLDQRGEKKKKKKGGKRGRDRVPTFSH